MDIIAIFSTASWFPCQGLFDDNDQLTIILFLLFYQGIYFADASTPKGFVKPQKYICHFDFIRVAFPFAFHPGSVAHVSFFSHKCTRQLRQMPNNRRRFLPRHENAAVASCTCGPRDQLNLLLAEVENVRAPPSIYLWTVDSEKPDLFCFIFPKESIVNEIFSTPFWRNIQSRGYFVFRKSSVQAEAFKWALLCSLVLFCAGIAAAQGDPVCKRAGKLA